MKLTGGSGTYEVPDVKAGMYNAAFTGELEQFPSPFPNPETGVAQQVARMAYRITDGPSEGEELMRFANLTNKDDKPVYGSPRATITQDVAAILGVEPEDAPRELDTDELVGRPVLITVKLKANKAGVKVPRIDSISPAE